MKTMTIRGLDDRLSEKLKQEARKESKSVNQFVIDSIRKSLGEEKEKNSPLYTTIWTIFLGNGRKRNLKKSRGKLTLNGILIRNFGNEAIIDRYQYLFICHARKC